MIYVVMLLLKGPAWDRSSRYRIVSVSLVDVWAMTTTIPSDTVPTPRSHHAQARVHTIPASISSILCFVNQASWLKTSRSSGYLLSRFLQSTMSASPAPP